MELTRAQQGIWYADQLGTGPAYRIGGYAEVGGDVDVDRLASCVRRAVAGAGCLHVRFTESDGRVRQEPVPARAELPVLRCSPGEARDRMLADLADATDLFGQALYVLEDGRVWWYQRYHMLVMDPDGCAALTRRAAALYAGAADLLPDGGPQDLLDAEAGYDPAADRAYWTDLLAGVSEPARLVEPARSGGRLALRRTVGRAVDPALAVAAVAAYTHRMTGAHDVVLGLPVSARLDQATRDVPGMVSTVLPLRVAVRPDTVTSDLVADVARAVAELTEHSRYRAEELCRDLRVPGGIRELVGPAVTVVPDSGPWPFVDLSRGPVSDLSFFVYPTHLVLAADPAACGPEALEDHERRFLAVLDAFDAAGPVGTIDLLSADECAQVLGEFAVADAPVADLTWPAAFEAQARRDPAAVAVVCESERLTYGELDAAANRVARLLRSRGVVAEDVVAVAVPRSVDLVVALLGVMKAGAAYLPLDLEHPADRLDYMVTDAAARLVLTVPALAGDVPAVRTGDSPVFLGDADGFDGTGLDVPVALDQAAYVIYTSGSTGRPKGVVCSHDGIGSLVATATERIGIDRSSRVIQFASVGFDVTVWDLVMSLCVGGRVIVVPAERRVAGRALTDYVAAHRATHMILPPSLVAALPGDCALPDGSVLIVGTETVPSELIARWARRLTVVAAYGLTEATVNSTLWPAEEDWVGPVPIGRPDPNTRCYVLDSALRPVPVGAVGEVYVGGRGLARGYLGRPGLTAGRFVADPYAGCAGARMYRTGDRARWRADGNLDFLGRSDGQLKIRGHRIEPGEIESAMMAYPGVGQAAVTVREDQPGVRHLVGYAVGDVDPVALRAHLADTLPEYMVPAVVPLDGPLPLTPNGKLDRSALPAPDWAAMTGDDAPTGPVEETLAALFAETLGLPRVGAHDNFFALGGDSIVAIGLVSRARRAGLTISPRDVFERRTVARLAAVAGDATTVVSDDGVGLVPATPITHWLRELGGEIATFHQSMLLTVPVGFEGVPAALAALVDRHDLLRSRLRRDADWALEVAPVGTGTMPLTTVAGPVSEAETRAAVGRLDPDAGVMAQAVWFPDAGRLFVALHHLVVDGVTWRILCSDLADLAGGRTPPPVGTSFRRWSQVLSAEALTRAAELDWWRGVFAGGVPEPGLRKLETRDSAGTAVHLTITLPAGLTAPLLTTVPAGYHGAVNDVLLTALAVAWSRWQDTALVLDLESHGREDSLAGVDLSGTLGWFTSIYPVRLDAGAVDWDEFLAGGPVVGRVLRRVKEQLRAVPGNGIGHGLLRHLNADTREALAALPVPPLLFNYLGRFAIGEATAWDAAPEAEPMGDAFDPDMPLGHLLEVNCAARDVAGEPALTATWTWPDGVFADGEVAALARLWFDALGALARHTGTGHSPSDFPLVALTQDEIDGYDAEVAGLADVLPVTPLQEGLYFHAHVDGNAADLYVPQRHIDLSGPLDPGALRRSAQDLLDRHAPLRASFRQRADGQVVQLIAARVDAEWREAVGDPDELAAAERARGFDPASGPLIRFLLVPLAADRHRLVLTLHHLVSDGWSEPLIVRELLARYAPGGNAARLGAVPSYRDYLEFVGGRDREAARAAWTGALGQLDGPTIVAPPGPPGRPVQLAVALPDGLTDALTARARDLGVTVHTVVQGAWGLLLGRRTASEDVVFGTTVSGRHAEVDGVESLVGALINTLPVRMRWSLGDSVATVLTRLQEEQSLLLDHQHLGLAELQRIGGVGALFDTLVVSENLPGGDLPRSGDLAVTGTRSLDATHYPLSLLVGYGDRLDLRLEHDPGRVDADAAARLADQLVLLLAAVASDPGRPVSQIDLGTWGPLTGASVPVPPSTVAELFAAQAARTPDAPAVVSGTQRASYAALDTRAGRLAAELVDRGVRPGEVVAVAVPRSVDLVVALLAVLKAGAAYLPVDAGYPVERVRFMLADSGARMVLTSADTRLPQVDGVTPVLVGAGDRPDGSGPALGSPAHDPGSRGFRPGDAAYLIYTSGSTGRPKGVVVSHGAIGNQLAWSADRFPLGVGDAVLQLASPSFDTSVWELFWPLTSGAAVVLPGDHLDPAHLAGLIRAHRVSAVTFVPSLVEAFLRSDDVTADPSWAASLRWVSCGGEALTADLAERWHALTGTRLDNFYGPTEAAVQVTWWGTDGTEESAVPLGGPVWNTRLYVLDAGLRPAAEGELYLAGDQLARGYHDRAGLTADRFVADPYGPAGARMYRTGDIVARRGDGALEYRGRTDQHVKVRGHRVELGEIEARLAAEPSVARAVVLARTDGPGSVRLVGYVVPVPGAAPAGDALRAWVAAALPAPMVPGVFVLLDALPLTPSGKVDRPALPAPDLPRAVPGAALAGGVPAVTPAGGALGVLRAVFAEVLRLSDVGPEEDFFVLGGDSILSISVSNRARREGIDISPREVFVHRTPAALATIGSPAAPPVATGPADDGVGDVPALPVMHWLREHSPDIAGYTLPMLITTPAGADAASIAATLQTVLDHHPALRLTLTRIASVLWSLETTPAGTVRATDLLRTVDLTGTGDLRERIAAEFGAAVRRLDPDTGVMVQAVWFDGGPDVPGRLLLAVHHLAVDGVSWRILFEDLAAAWRGEPLEPVGTSLRTYAKAVAAQAQGPGRLTELTHWARTLAPGADLVPGATVGGTARRRVTRLTSAETAPLLTTVPAAVHADVTDVLLAALRIAVDSPADLLVDVERHGREDLGERLDLSRTVGWFTSVQPVRLAPGAGASSSAASAAGAGLGASDGAGGGLSAGAGARSRSGSGATVGVGSVAGWEVVKQVKERLREAPDGGLGHGLLRYLNAQVAPILARMAAPQVLFNYFGRFPSATGADWTPAPEADALDVVNGGIAPSHLLQVDAVCEETPDGPRLTVTWTWSDGGLSEEDVAALGERWADALRDLASDVTGTSGLTPSDLTVLALGQDDIVRVEAAAGGAVADIWPLSPLQEGLYFHSSYDAGAIDLYTAQDYFDLARVDVDRLRAAGRALLARNPSVRAGFTSDGLASPVQFVAAGCELPVTEVDLTGLDPESRPLRVAELMAADRTRRFDLARPPLCRLLLIRLGDTDRLVVSHHLILWDGWSEGLFLQELFSLYETGGAGGETPGSYRDYLVWLAGQDTAASALAWRDALAGLAEPTLVAPAGRDPRPVIPHRHEAVLSERVSDRVRAGARSAGVTLNAVLNAAWALALSNQVGRDDVVFGTTVAGRPADVPGVESVIGLFLNTVPVRVALDPRETVGALLRRIQDDRGRLMAHEHVGLGVIQREAGHTHLFDTLYVLQNFSGGDDDLAGLKERHGIVSSGSVDATHYPLVLVIAPREKLLVRLDYRADLFAPAAAEALLTRFTTIVERLVEDTSVLVGALDVVPARERDRLAVDWDASRRPLDGSTVADLLAERVARTPDETALVFCAQVWTYAELDARINRLARLMADAGAGPERVVALALPRSADMVAALFAVLRTGAAYLPLDLDYPAERLAFMLDDAAPLCVVSTVAVAATLPDTGVPALLIDDPATAATLDALPADPLRRTFNLEHPAYLIYTSGSTGRPKGVVTPYRGLTNMQLNHREAIFDPVVAGAGGRRLRIAHTVSFSFDMSWEELLWLVEGHEVHVCDEELRRDAEALVAYCDTHRIDVINVTPTYAHHLIEEGLLAEGHYRPALVLLGGEAVSDAVWSALRDAEGTLGYNLYGPTEYTINTLGGGTTDSDTPTIGRAIWNTRAYVLDSCLRPVPVGAPGELYVGGVGLARGYHARPGLTADRFVADPFGAVSSGSLSSSAKDASGLREAGARMYRTGDLVRQRPDGNLDFLGRTDDQVKIRGYRIELGEVEAAVEAHPDVTHAAVVVLDKRLVGYVVGDAPTLREYLKARLPAYMVPAALVSVDRLPLTVNGKLDIRALPAPDATPAVPSRAPATEAERVLCALYADVLGVGTVGVDDSFFDLGGHSLLATRLVSRARTALSADLSIRDLFEAPTVADLVRRIGVSDRAALVPQDRPERLPLSFAQRRLWLVQQLDGDSSAYNFPIAFSVRGALDLGALRAAFGDVAGRHEALRTVFAEHDGRPYQRILDADVPFEVVADLDLAATIDRPFDLSTEVPLRVTVSETAPGEHLVVVLLHHVTTDEWSDGPFLADLAAAYAARLAGSAPDWAPLPVQYADYTLWQQGLDTTAQLDYWRTALAGLPEEIELPTDRARPAVPDFRGGAERIAFTPEVADGVRRLAQEYGASAFMVFQAAVAALLSRLGCGTDIPFGVPVAGRTDEALDDLVGFFVNTVVLREDVSGDPTMGELVARVRETNLAAFDHQDVPFEAVVEACNPTRSTSRNPLFQVMLSYRNPVGDDFALAGLETAFVDFETGTAKFDLAFTFSDGDAYVEYRTDLFDPGTVTTIGQRLTRLLGAAVADPTLRVGEIDILDADERHRVLEGFNDTARPVAELSMIAAFEARVAISPDSVAVVDRHRSVSYAQLDERATAIARLLAARGVGREDVVALALPRSADLVAAVLGTLKLGAAFLPLDLAHPADRLSYMLTDSGARLVVAAPETALPDVLPRLSLDETGDAPLPPAPTGVDHAAYVIYTSGSTGRPKGVVLTHEGIGSLVATAVHRMGIAPDSRVLQFASIGFDVFVFELAMALCVGGRLVCVPDDARVPGPALTGFVAERRITHMILPPSLVSALPADCELPKDAVVLVGTETVPPDLVGRWAERLRLFGAYGLTEATVNSTLWDAVPGWTGAVPIGVPDPNTRCYVLDAALRPAPVGVVGELYVGGRGLARGYLGRPGLTAERFVADPFVVDGGPGSSAQDASGPRPSARMYRTGDRARWRADGNLDFLGRVDDQVKIRGFRIELGEIEAVLARHPGVAQAAVVAHRDGDITRLVGYVVPAGTGVLDPADVRAGVVATLPEYMVPTAVVVLDGPLPLTPNGKLDRRRLPVPDWAGLTGGDLPVTREQEILAGLFGEILGLADVGVHDNFFALGGHSMAAMRLVGRIRAAFGVELAVRDVFDAPTVAGVTALLSTAVAGRAPLRPRPAADVVPIAPAQRRHWTGRDAAPDIALVLRPSNPLDPEALAAAVRDVVQRHPALRTEIVPGGAWPVQRPARAWPALEVLPGGADLDGRLRMLAGERSAPAFRVRLLTDGAGAQALLLTASYLFVDEWSVVPLVGDLNAAYAARVAGRAPGGEPLPVSYADYALWAHEVLGDPADPTSLAARQLGYWREALRGVPVEVEIATDRPRPAAPTGRGDVVAFRLDEDLHRGVDALARWTGTSMFMVLQAALAALLTGGGAGTDLPIGTLAAGRTEDALAGLVGCFVNTLVLRTDTAGDPSFAELLRRVRETDLRAFDHADVPIGDVLAAAGLDATHPRVMVVHHEEATLPGGLGDLDEVPTGAATADLTLSFYEPRGDAPVHCDLIYRTDLFDRATAERLTTDLLAVLGAAVGDPHRPLSDITKERTS
ncbi:hypothetical protein Lfu02_08800 [Longispora fulva]|uniref:Amino acid adenylation domain-containing protein/non-ribosomal peptide synthase protein (TIGR01720 family) n=1 Tax=Longispora fulva TaxID=619741 RepID=A0A8J7KEQ4_9ACTN|nr:non-ribosomal peptide synthetase [Longispora fulva]MBG6135255.1 amino acid adenylation domain-containing protein/non-ribosomal peptide synthase protein (TIGR01720 family) [Longispora fulva]GIG56508.1 hypothetical protein Lfu02_08800 [Longispora fulva]